MTQFPFWPDWYIEDERKDLLGAGSFGQVYKIRRDDLGMQTVCALKVIRVPQDASEVEELRDRSMDDRSIAAYYDQTAQGIAEEIKLLLTLKYCPNIVRIEDYHLERNPDGFGFTVYIRMPLLDNLEDRARTRFKSGQPFTAEEVVEIGSDICDALTACEKKNIIHRDIKPGNIFIDEDGTYILGDFGIARQMDSSTQSMHSQKGTMNYMAPEILRGERGYDRSVDYYSLGTMLYRYLNHNRFPYEPRFPRPITPMDSNDVLAKRLSGAAVELPDEASPALGEAIRRACAPDPKDRYRSAAEMKQAILEGLAAGPSVTASYARPKESDGESTIGAVGYTAAGTGTFGAAAGTAGLRSGGTFGAASGTAEAAGTAVTAGAWNAAVTSAEELTGDSTVSAVDQDLWALEQKRREEEKARKEAEEKARIEAEKARQEAEAEKKRQEEEEIKRREAEEAARLEEEKKRKAAAAKSGTGDAGLGGGVLAGVHAASRVLLVAFSVVFLAAIVGLIPQLDVQYYGGLPVLVFLLIGALPLIAVYLIHRKKIPFLSVIVCLLGGALSGTGPFLGISELEEYYGKDMGAAYDFLFTEGALILMAVLALYLAVTAVLWLLEKDRQRSAAAEQEQ